MRIFSIVFIKMSPKGVIFILISIIAVAALVLGIISIVRVSGKCKSGESFRTTMSPSAGETHVDQES